MFEEYINNPVNRLNTLFDEIIKRIKYWFEEGSFSKEGLTVMMYREFKPTEVSPVHLYLLYV